MAVRSGKAILDGRVEYPLPKRHGVQDYVVYFVGAGDGYGKSARRYFDRFYRDHKRRSATSLEEMIDFLHTEVTSGGVAQVRELVIVAHGAPQGLMTHVTRTVPAGLPGFVDVTARSLAVLQRRFRANDPAFASFARHRTEVVRHLLDDSWITIRACRVGQGEAIMYALFSFFGGRANVYAPREYQFFGTHPIKEGMRVESKIDVHDHLVKQHIYPRDVHTPERKNAIVESLVDPGRFGQAFDLASARIGDTTSPQAVTYDGFVRALNRSRISDGLKARFAAEGHALSTGATARVAVKDAAWIVRDRVRHDTVDARVTYDVGEEVESGTGGQVATLRAAASIADAYSTRQSFPIQLFFYESENNLWNGKVGALASFLEGEPDSAAGQARLTALETALPTDATPAALAVLVRTTLKDRTGVEPSAQARVRLVSTVLKHGQVYKTWAIQDQEPYLIKLEHPLTANDTQGHILWLVRDLRGAAKVRAENELMAFLGKDPDTPGTELPAYLDRFTIDELVGLIDHLRSPYQLQHSFYLHHAQQAIKRKKEYFKWSTDRQAGNTDPLGPLVDPYESLTGRETEDKRIVAHEFDFNGIWQEVKVSHPKLGVVQADLFAEEDLWDKLDLPGDPNAPFAALELDADSPYTDLEEQRLAELQGLERFSVIDKSEFEPTDQDLSCAELAAILTKWKDLQGADADEISRQLGLVTASDGATFLDHVMWLYDKYKIGKIGVDLVNISFMRDGLAVKIASRIPVIGIASEIGVPTTFTALLRIAPAITIPLTLWLKTLEAEAEADQVWENTGKLTAVRQWLRELIVQTYRADFPDNVHIDLGWFGSTVPHVERYYEEQRDEDGVFFSFVWADGRMKKGFDEGVRLMEKAYEEILERADDAVDEVLRQLDVDSCKAKVLVDAGLLDLRRFRAQVVRAIATDLLAKLPKV